MEDIEEKKKRISELKAEKDRLHEELDRLPEAWADQLQPFIEVWIDQAVNYQVKDNPDVVKELGMEKIKSLKQKIQEFKDGHRERIELKATMPHHKSLSVRKPSNTDPERYTLKTTYFEDIVSRSLSPFGRLVDEYGLLKVRGHSFGYGKTSPTGFNDHQIRHEISCRPAAYSEYSRTYKRYFELTDELCDLKKELDHLEAQSLWNES